ncbi:MAG TPA: hypothetical protein VLB76_18035 [Thermoanaerobaculia bacterium]|jgi:hypothetical protein|nr:hypothetical protein [Thermoanaerobaculia bacterium]
MNKVWLTLLAVGVLGYFALTRPRASGSGDPVDWSREPIQEPTDRPAFAVDTRKGEMTLEPRAAFDISALVAADERYRADDGAFLVPVDLVMTWGKLQEEPFKSKVSYGQMARYYFWRTSATDLDLRYVASHSANMHMIPANGNVRRALLAVGGGDPVRVHGLLVNAKRADGFYWNSSLTREDTGPGACELVWVEEIQIGRKVYR